MNGTETRQLMIGMFGFAAVGLMVMTQGCSSSSSNNNTDASDGPMGPVTNPLITDFSGMGGLVGTGAPFTFQDTGLTAPTASIATGALVATFDTGVPTTMYPYAGFGMPFTAVSDVSMFAGVKFKASGTLSTGCTIQFSLADADHSASPPFGTCTGSCYPGAKIFDLPASATDVTVMFADIGMGGPSTPTNTMKATAVQWQLNIPAGAAPATCSGSVTIDDVNLVH